VPASVEIRLLQKEDSRREFSCGEPALDRFFQHYAGQSQFKLRIAVTYVASVADRIVGFATVTAASIERASLPSERLRRKMPAYPLPVLRLARLGVDLRAQGLGVGKAMLAHVLSLSVKQRESLGWLGVVTDARPQAVEFYERYGFERLTGIMEGQVHGDPTPMFLGTDTIASSILL